MYSLPLATTGYAHDFSIAPRGCRAVNPPQEVVTRFLGRGDLDRPDPAALRVEDREHVPNQAVLAGGVHALEDDQRGSLCFGEEPVLLRVNALQVVRNPLCSITFAVPTGGCCRTRVGEAEIPAAKLQ